MLYVLSYKFLDFFVLSYGHVGFIVQCLPLYHMSMFIRDHLVMQHDIVCRMRLFNHSAHSVCSYELLLVYGNSYGKQQVFVKV